MLRKRELDKLRSLGQSYAHERTCGILDKNNCNFATKTKKKCWMTIRWDRYSLVSMKKENPHKKYMNYAQFNTEQVLTLVDQFWTRYVQRYNYSI